LMDREHVRLVDRLRIDALIALHMAERGKTVAIDRRALEIEIVRGILHCGGDFLLHLAGTARKERLSLRNEFGIVLGRYLAGAGAGAALDLEKQAGPRPVLEERIGAGTQEKRPLQRVDRAVDRARRGERPEIVALARARAAMLENSGSRVVAGDENI